MTLCRALAKPGRGRLLRRRGLPPADDRRGADARRAARDPTSRSGPPDAIDFAAQRLFGVLAPVPGDRRRDRATCAPLAERAHAAGALVAVGDRPARADAAARRRASSAPTSRSARRSASACRSATAGRTRPSSRRSDEHKRQLPGRIVGVSKDARGPAAPTGWRCRRASSTSAARRRRATSARRRCCSRSWPRCTPSTTARRACGGSRGASTRSRARSQLGLRRLGFDAGHGPFFDTLRVRTERRGRPRDPRRARERGHQPARPTRTARSASRSTRRRCPATSQTLFAAFAGAAVPFTRRAAGGRRRRWPCPRRFARTSAFLDAPRLQPPPLRARDAALPRAGCEARDLSLAHSMIPLGSCTMKLNATAEMMPVTWPELAQAAPVRAGRAGRRATASCSPSSSAGSPRSPGFAAVSLQPNAGAQGEYAGLLAIRAYHQSRGEAQPQRLPDPGLGARHQPGERGAWPASRSWRSPATRTATSTSPTCGRKRGAARGRARRADGHLPLDARRVRGGDPRDLRDRPRRTAARSTWTART